MSNEPVATALLAALQDVRVQPDQLAASVGTRELQAESPRQLRRLLSNALYEVLHTGAEQTEGPLPFRLRDRSFERTLADAVPHRETSVRARVLAVGEGDGSAEPRYLVALDGVRVWVPFDQIGLAGVAAVGEIVTVANTPCRPALSPGFFLVQGSRSERSGEPLRVYVHLPDWRETAAIWGRVLEHLEQARAAYRAKVLSAEDLYPRRDALVVYLDPEWLYIAHELADLLRGMPGVGAETSLFTHRLGPGVAAAWEPRDDRPGMTGLSFGQHRASAVAEALVDTADGSAPLATVLRAKLAAANINPTHVALNVGSMDISEPLVPA